MNLDHLYLGTTADNARDRKLRNRGVRGERINTAKLSEVQVQEIRWLHKRESSRDVATFYGVTQAMVCAIWRGDSWAWLPYHLQAPSQEIQRRIQAGGRVRRAIGRARGSEKKSRAATGARNPSVKLTEAQVREIRARFARGDVQQQIADDFGIAQTTVSSIGHFRSWAHLAA